MMAKAFIKCIYIDRSSSHDIKCDLNEPWIFIATMLLIVFQPRAS